MLRWQAQFAITRSRKLKKAADASHSVRLGFQGLELVLLGYGCCCCYWSSKACPADVTPSSRAGQGTQGDGRSLCRLRNAARAEGQAYENRR